MRWLIFVVYVLMVVIIVGLFVVGGWFYWDWV